MRRTSIGATPALQVVVVLAFMACASRQAVEAAPTPELPAPHPGSAFVVHAFVEGLRDGRVSLLSAVNATEADLVTREAPLESLGLAVFRSDEDVTAAGHTLSAPVDFSRWVLVVPVSAPPRLVPLAATSRWVEAEDRAVEVHLGNPCAGICGGASDVQRHLRECQMAHLADAYLVPRPVAELRIVRTVDRGCDPRLP